MSTLFSFIDVVLVPFIIIAAVAESFFFIIVYKNISTFLGCQWNGILQMNKALAAGNERRILRQMKSNFFSPWGKKEKGDPNSIRYFISYTDIQIENENMVGGS